MNAELVVPVRDGIDADRELIGGKAWSLTKMVRLGLPVPPACVIPTGVCDAFHGPEGEAIFDRVLAGLPPAIGWIGDEVGRDFGGSRRPLLLSVRSGAPTSMPGMMDTVLNVGIDDAVERALAKESRSPGWAAALRRRLREDLARLPGGEAADSSPSGQVEVALRAVLASWNSDRAVAYREHQGIPDRPGTAIVIQAMVFGNLDERSGTGVAFTRNPLDGSPELFGEWLERSQGEDLVSGQATPADLGELSRHLPEAYAGLSTAASTLESSLRDMQDIEFTVQSGRLYLLQTRAGKRSPEAAVRIAVELAEEGVISPEEALGRLGPELVAGLARESADGGGTALAAGMPASPGLARGVVVDDADEAARRGAAGEHVVLARPTTDPGDVHGMIAAVAVATEIGGATSHAALVARDLAKPCVVGCGAGTLAALVGETVVVDGGSGRILRGDHQVGDAGRELSRHEAQLARWAEDAVSLRVLGPEDDVTDPTAVELKADLRDSLRRALRGGARTVVAERRLPALLTLWRIELEEGGDGAG
jgi:pyruvate,orthophosphate dikinase